MVDAVLSASLLNHSQRSLTTELLRQGRIFYRCNSCVIRETFRALVTWANARFLFLRREYVTAAIELKPPNRKAHRSGGFSFRRNRPRSGETAEAEGF